MKCSFRLAGSAIANDEFPGEKSNLRSGDEFRFTDDEAQGLLCRNGFAGFSDFWRLPGDFVEPVNYRRGGWSAVSKLTLADGGMDRHFYVKRQEGQFRRSWVRPLRHLTYFYEMVGIRFASNRGLPSVDVAGYGFRKRGKTRQGVIVTRAIDGLSLSEFHQMNLDWNSILPGLARAGRQLHRMHLSRFQHGALFPQHLFLDPDSGEVKLIDFERSRMRLTVSRAMASDLSQFLNRVDWMPEFALSAFLKPYCKTHSALLAKLRAARQRIRRDAQ